MFETIVVSVDGSEPSSHALSTAVDIAKRYGARLTILHAVMDDAPLSSLIEVAERNGFMDQITAELDEATSIKPVPVPITAAPLVAIPEELLGKIGSLLLEKSVSQARALGLEEVETALLGERPHCLRHQRARRDQELLPGQRLPQVAGRGHLPLFGGEMTRAQAENAARYVPLS
jgi:nucleotide-binding universal stress UspA family protein